jgi:hypothetical protein
LAKNFELVEATCGSYLHILVDKSRLQVYTFIQVLDFQHANWFERKYIDPRYPLKVVKKPMNQMYQVLQCIVMSFDQVQMSCKSGFTIWL